MPIGYHFDEIERAAFGLTEENYEDEVFDKPIGGMHGDETDDDDDGCIGGMHGYYRERRGVDDECI